MAPKSTSRDTIDWGLYLVTDSTPEILGGKDLIQVVEQAIVGGVGTVQYREKHADTCVMIEVATRLHAVTHKYQVPLLINDRLDVCQAVGAEGVHIGQDDMDLSQARRILGPNAIIGVTASSTEEGPEGDQRRCRLPGYWHDICHANKDRHQTYHWNKRASRDISYV